MKNISVIFMCILIMSSCTQNNGHIGFLFGQWQLKEVVKNEVCISSNDKSFVSFQNKVALFREMESNMHGSAVFVGLFLHKEDSISFNMHYGESKVFESFFISDTISPSFCIKKLNNRHMVLSNDSMEWIFKKF